MSASSNPAGPPKFSFKPVRQPMLWVVTAYALGITAGIYAWRPALWWICATLAFLTAAVYFRSRRNWLAGVLTFHAFFLVGALHVQVRSAVPRVDTGIRAFASGQEVQVTAHVIRDGRLRQDSFDEPRQTVDLETEQLETAGSMLPLRSGIRLTVYTPRRKQAGSQDNSEGNETADVPSLPPHLYTYGERLSFSTKLRVPHNFRNPGAFDYEQYLAENGIAVLASAKADAIELLPGLAGGRISRWRAHARRSVIARVHQLWPPDQAALIDAMVIGEDAFIDRDTRVDFQRSGTYHILVVSGMNVSILAFVIFWTLRHLRLPELPSTLLTIASCFAYAFLTEVGAPVWRATLMCSVYLCTRLLYRDRATLNSLGLAALVLLVLDPRQLFTASFQMTFVCLLVVTAIAIPFLERTSQLYRRALANWGSQVYAASLPPSPAQFRSNLELVVRRLARFIGESWSLRVIRVEARIVFAAYELLFVSAVMQMGLALPMAVYFHRATTVGVPANLAAVPLTELMMPSAIAALALSSISRWLAKIPVLLTSITLEGITGTVRGLGAIRAADLRVAAPSVFLVALAVAALLAAMIAARRCMRYALAGIAAIFITAIALATLPPRPNLHTGLEVTSIDVGQGDSTLLVTPQGRTLLIDAGGPAGIATSQLDFGEDVVSPYLWTRGISHLDAVAITHGHSDHIQGIPAVLKNFRPRELWIGLLPPSAALEKIVAEAQRLNVQIVRHAEGDEFNFGGATISVLSPAGNAVPGSRPENNDSLVLRVNYEESSALLEGDAQKQIERRIAGEDPMHADLLKIGHHGSDNATTEELLQAVNPRFAVISVGVGNTYKHPRFSVLERLANSGTRVYRTDLDGAVTFYLDGHSVTPRPADLE